MKYKLLEDDMLAGLVSQKHEGDQELLFESPFEIYHDTGGGCRLWLGPVSQNRDLETHEKWMERQKSATYLTSVLLGAESLRTSLVTREKLLRRRLINHAIKSVVYPMTVNYNCENKDICKTEEQKNTARRLIREISAVIQPEFPDMTFDMLNRNVGQYVLDPPSELNIMMSNIAQGLNDDVNVSFQFLLLEPCYRIFML